MSDVVHFGVVDADPPYVLPTVNGTTLVETVAKFEAVRGFSPAGGYGGLSLDSLDVGDLTSYLLGRPRLAETARGRVWLLGCDCGEVGCWPLEATVDVEADLVVWTDFGQPHRPGWDYTGLGPFVFDRDQYERAASEAATAWVAISHGSPRG